MATSREKKAGLEDELAAAEADRKDVRDIQKSLGDEAEDLQKAETELVDLERLLAASDDIISKNDETMKDKQRIAALESQVRNAWMVTTALFLTLSVGAGIQVYTARHKFAKFVDDPERTDADQAGPDAEEVGIRA